MTCWQRPHNIVYTVTHTQNVPSSHDVPSYLKLVIWRLITTAAGFATPLSECAYPARGLAAEQDCPASMSGPRGAVDAASSEATKQACWLLTHPHHQNAHSMHAHAALPCHGRTRSSRCSAHDLHGTSWLPAAWCAQLGVLSLRCEPSLHT